MRDQVAKVAILLPLMTTVVSAQPEPGVTESPAVPDSDNEPEPDSDGELATPVEKLLGGAEVIVIQGPPLGSDAAQSTISRADAERVPGTQGDPVKAVRVFAGVARSGAGSGDLVVWGTSPAHTRLYIDGVPVPRIFHAGGTRSVTPSQMVSAVRLTPGGYSAAYGGGLGGMVQVETKWLRDSKRAAAVAIDPLDATLFLQTPIAPNTHLAIGARRGLLTYSAALVDTRAQQLVPIPDYYDYQALAQHTLGETSTLRISLFGAGDKVQRGIPSVVESADFSEESTTWFHRVAAVLERRKGVAVTGSLSLWAGQERDQTVMTFNDGNALADMRVLSLGLNLMETRALSSWLTLRSGIEAQVSRTRLRQDGAITLPAREGDIGVFGQPPGNRVNEDNWSVRTASVAGHLTFAVEPDTLPWQIDLGLRVEPMFVDGDRILPVRPTEPEVGLSRMEFTLAPRVRLTWRAVQQWLQLYCAAGRFYQGADPRDLSPIFGNPEIGSSHAWHGLAGVLFTGSQVSVEATGFVINLSHLAVRSTQPTPPLAALLENRGLGRSIGAQLSVRYRLQRQVYAWATYSLMRAQRSRSGDSGSRLFDDDQTHIAQALLSVSLGPGLELGARGVLSSGTPYTPVIDAVFNAASGVYDPVFGPHNSERLPLYLAVSARLAWQKKLTWGYSKLWLEIQNLANRANAEEVFYSADYRRRGFVYGLPILPLIGVEFGL